MNDPENTKTLYLTYGAAEGDTFKPDVREVDASGYQPNDLATLLKELSPETGFVIAQLKDDQSGLQTALIGEVLTPSEMEKLAQTDADAQKAWHSIQKAKQECELNGKNCWGMSDQAIVVKSPLQDNHLYQPTEPSVFVLAPDSYEQLWPVQNKEPVAAPAKPGGLIP
jgi:hypothetical protein